MNLITNTCNVMFCMRQRFHNTDTISISHVLPNYDNISINNYKGDSLSLNQWFSTTSDPMLPSVLPHKYSAMEYILNITYPYKT